MYNYRMKTVKAEKPASRKLAKTRKRRTGDIQVIARSAQILRILGDFNGLSLAGIAENVGLPRSTVHRIVLALETERLASSNGPGQYRLGPEIARLAEASKLDSIRELHPYLVRLSRDLNETVDLSIRTGLTVTFVDQIVAMRRLRAVSALGRAFPLHCTANGKAVLAALPDDLASALMSEPLEPLTAKTIVDKKTLMQNLAEIRRSGIAFDREEHTVGICAVGGCLELGNGELVAISIPLPAGRFYGQEERLSQALSGTLTRITSNFPQFRRATERGAGGKKAERKQA
jgi:DNA-binding IclR family transcriptional regulator